MSSCPTSLNPAPAGAISGWWSVNETLLRHPNTVAVFNAFGVDACCGGAASLARAAIEVDVPLDELLDALNAAASGVAGRAP